MADPEINELVRSYLRALYLSMPTEDLINLHGVLQLERLSATDAATIAFCEDRLKLVACELTQRNDD